MKQVRYDAVEVKARITPEGYIFDTPSLTRTGVFEYVNPDGSIRKEYRPESSVFHEDSLKAYKGLPITWKHQSYVNRDHTNAFIGSVLSEGRQDGENLTAEVVIYNPECIEKGDRELSLGYSLELDETPGVTPCGQRYDAIQTNIIPNHLAVVTKGRAGTARFNLDSIDEDIMEEKALKEKILALEEAARASAEEQARMQARLDEAIQEAETVRSLAKLRLDCAKVGAEFVDGDVKASREAIIKKVLGDTVRLDGRDLETMQSVAMDLFETRELTAQKNAEAVASTRFNEDSGTTVMSAEEARRKYVLGE